MTEKLGQVSGDYFIDEVFPDGGRTLRWEQHYDVSDPWAVDKEAPWRAARDEAFEEMARLHREEGGEYRLYHQKTDLIYKVQATRIDDTDAPMALRLTKLATMAEKADHWTAEERLMPATGVADLVWEAIEQLEDMERRLKEVLKNREWRTENQ